MTHKIHDIGVAKHIGVYSDAIESTAGLRWLHTSGTPGLMDNGEIPTDIESQAALACQHILAMSRPDDFHPPSSSSLGLSLSSFSVTTVPSRDGMALKMAVRDGAKGNR